MNNFLVAMSLILCIMCAEEVPPGEKPPTPDDKPDKPDEKPTKPDEKPTKPEEGHTTEIVAEYKQILASFYSLVGKEIIFVDMSTGRIVDDPSQGKNVQVFFLVSGKVGKPFMMGMSNQAILTTLHIKHTKKPKKDDKEKPDEKPDEKPENPDEKPENPDEKPEVPEAVKIK